ncbi:MAG: hypothetical protein J6S83_11960, partial [Lachnospiraceae bacterium]|nr:hypothetical protein [Lachnospiraceae bacterium]
RAEPVDRAVAELPGGTEEGGADPGGGAVSGPTIDEQIAAVERYIQMLKDDRKKLKEKLAENRQDMASAKAMLARYLDGKKVKT